MEHAIAGIRNPKVDSLVAPKACLIIDRHSIVTVELFVKALSRMMRQRDAMCDDAGEKGKQAGEKRDDCVHCFADLSGQ